MCEDLRQKILDIICKEWPTPDGYLLGFDIYEQLTAGCDDAAPGIVKIWERTHWTSERR
jgi:hypothetical protein